MGVPKITNGIKHDFPFSLLLTLHKVPREVLKTEGEARGFHPRFSTIPIDLVNVMHQSFVSTAPPPSYRIAGE